MCDIRFARHSTLAFVCEGMTSSFEHDEISAFREASVQSRTKSTSLASCLCYKLAIVSDIPQQREMRRCEESEHVEYFLI
jgi:plasmid maintenance system killer protein